jgi:hypothetical protein
MANDRFYCRCTRCGDYLWLGKYYPGTAVAFATDDVAAALQTFIESHLSRCQPQDGAFSGDMCLVFDNEATFCAAGGFIGGAGNIHLDAHLKDGVE